MTASVQTVKKFSDETGISITKVKELIRQGVIPMIPREGDICMQLINRLEFDKRLESNQIRVPFSERSVRRAKEAS